MLSDVTLQFHISYFCQDNDGGRHCQGMISDNSRRVGDPGGDLCSGFSGLRETAQSKKCSFFVHCHFQDDCKFWPRRCWDSQTFTHPDKLPAVKVFTGLVFPFILGQLAGVGALSQTKKYLPSANLCDTHLCGGAALVQDMSWC